MAPRGKMVDAEEIERWAQEGRSSGWVAEKYLEKYGIEVSRFSTNSWLNKYRDNPRPRVVPPSWNPWKRNRLQSTTSVPRVIQRLLLLYRYENGEELDGSQLEHVGRLMVLLRADPVLPTLRQRVRERATELVVDYDPETDRYDYVGRRKGIDKGWIREPWFRNDGSRRSLTELDALSLRDEAIRDFLIADA